MKTRKVLNKITQPSVIEGVCNSSVCVSY